MTTRASTGHGLTRAGRRLRPRWTHGYGRATARADAVAGLTVAVLLVPQGMAYAVLAGLPPVAGLYASTLPIVVYALLGSSGQLAVGPVAIVALLTGSAVAPRAGDAGEAVALSALLALMVGGLQLLVAALRLSWLVTALTHPVVTGFTSAAAIVIALSQVRGLLGIDAAGSDTAVDAAVSAVAALDTVHVATLVVGVAAVALLLAVRRWLPRVPGPLLVLVGGVAVSAAAGLTAHGVDVVGTIPAGLPVPSLPPLDVGAVVGMLPAAAAIALIGYAEGWSVARAVARTTGEHPGADRELVAVGSANVAAGLVSAFPVAGGFSRTAVNHEAGARTPAAGLVTAAILAVVVSVATPLLEPLPQAVLAAVIVVAVLRLVDLGEIVRLWRTRRSDGLVAAVTFLATLGAGVEPGLAVGVAAGLLARLWQRRRPDRPADSEAATTP